jgi:hypothetical protein
MSKLVFCIRRAQVNLRLWLTNHSTFEIFQEKIDSIRLINISLKKESPFGNSVKKWARRDSNLRPSVLRLCSSSATISCFLKGNHFFGGQPLVGSPCTGLNATDWYVYRIAHATVVSERMSEYLQQVMRDPQQLESAHRDQTRSNAGYLCKPAPPTRAGCAGQFPL